MNNKLPQFTTTTKMTYFSVLHISKKLFIQLPFIHPSEKYI